MAIRRLVRAEDAARESGADVDEIRRKVERGDIEGFECDGVLFVPDDTVTPGADDGLASVGWLRTWAQESGFGDELTA